MVGTAAALMDFQIHPAQFAEPCIDSGLKVGGAGGDRVSMGVGGVCAGNQRLLDTARHRVHRRAYDRSIVPPGTVLAVALKPAIRDQSYGDEYAWKPMRTPFLDGMF